jgi:hypothetical protein
MPSGLRPEGQAHGVIGQHKNMNLADSTPSQPIKSAVQQFFRKASPPKPLGHGQMVEKTSPAVMPRQNRGDQPVLDKTSPAQMGISGKKNGQRSRFVGPA